MKRWLLGILVLGLVLGVVVYWAGQGSAAFQYFDNNTYTYGDFNDSPHDFDSGLAYPTGNTLLGGIMKESCQVCHIPHAAATTVALWGHNTTNQSFTPYSSYSLNATVGQPKGVSLACLSCHDGVTAILSGGVNKTIGIASEAYVGINLTGVHPVSFTYGDTLVNADGELASPASNGYVASIFPLFGSGKDQLECGTCHDVHNSENTNTAGGPAQHLLRSKYGGTEAFCEKCHNK